MFAKNLEIILAELSQNADVPGGVPPEFVERFTSLRNYGKLPRGRERRGQALTNCEIVAAVMGCAAGKPNWAGHVAIILCGLRPVGGINASFFRASTLEEAVERILGDRDALKCFIRLDVSTAESGINSHGFATLRYMAGDDSHQVFFVPREAASLLREGAELGFDPDHYYSPMCRGTTFNFEFFRRLVQEIELAEAFPMPVVGDGTEYDAEEEQQERYKRLGVLPSSRFLNIEVDNQVTWPKTEMRVRFDRYSFVLMPKTKDNVQSIHIDLAANRLSVDEAVTIANRFLSVMTWCDDQFSIVQGGWAGNPIPVAVPRRNLAFTTAHDWVLNRSIPSTEEARRALALYREARNAQQNFMVSYAVLNFVKVVEIRHPGKAAVKKWFSSNFAILQSRPNHRTALDRFSAICGTERPHEYIWQACRVAVAHVGKTSKSDPDDAAELKRLHTAADVLHILARHFIKTELGISNIKYSGD